MLETELYSYPILTQNLILIDACNYVPEKIHH